EQSRWPLVLIPVALLLAVAAVVIFWPRLVGNLTSEQAAIGSLSPDTAAHAGGLTDSTALNEGGGESSADDATEPSERPQQPAQEATPPAAQANNSLRGSAPVNPAQGGFTWVVGSGNEQSAARLVERYRSQGFRASVLQGEANGLTVYRIALGQFTSRTEANRFRSQLPADAPAESWILSLGTP
ncbi:MAG: SPOR domain-containing protein, partial [Rubricoccaceae bacterium]|nr:SPOR domain-containing protein [Rubricoccaceae bacterium]